ncbi:unnamed protein product [Closterium sp. NIES-53]
MIKGHFAIHFLFCWRGHLIQDPTNRLEGSLHWKVMADADNKSRLKRGSALLLRKVVVFSPRKGLQYINITLANVVQVSVGAYHQSFQYNCHSRPFTISFCIFLLSHPVPFQVFPPDTPIPPVSAFRPSSSDLPGPRVDSTRSPPFSSTASPPVHTLQSPMANQQPPFAMPRHRLAEDSPFSSKNPHLHTQRPQSPSSLGTNRVPASPQPVTHIPSSAPPPRPATGTSVQINSAAAAGGTVGYPAPFTSHVPNPSSNAEMMPKTTPASRVPAATIERREKAWDFTSIDAEDADICLTPMVPDAALESHRGGSGTHVSAMQDEGEERIQPASVRGCEARFQGESAREVGMRGTEENGEGGDCLKRNGHEERGSEEAIDVLEKLGWDADGFGAFFEDDVDGLFAPLTGK